MAAQRTAVDFPLPSNPKAPRWDGKEDTLQDFLDQFNQLATHYNADDANKKTPHHPIHPSFRQKAARVLP